jgi:hypothetical protein
MYLFISLLICFSRLESLNPPHLMNCASIAPSRLISRSKLTKKWQERQISNFEYLMVKNPLFALLSFFFDSCFFIQVFSFSFISL